MKNVAAVSILASLAVTASAHAINKPVVQGCDGNDGSGECWDLQVDEGKCITVPEIAASRIHSLRYGEPLYCEVFDDAECTAESSSAADPQVAGRVTSNNAVGSVQCWSTTANLRRNDLARRAKAQRAKQNAAEGTRMRRRSSSKKFQFPVEIQSMIEKERDEMIRREREAAANKARMAQIAQEAAASAAVANALHFGKRDSSNTGMRRRSFHWGREFAKALLIEKAKDMFISKREDESEDNSEDAKRMRRRSSDKKFAFPAEIQNMIEKERDEILRREREAAAAKARMAQIAQEAAATAAFTNWSNKRDLAGDETSMRRRSFHWGRELAKAWAIEKAKDMFLNKREADQDDFEEAIADEEGDDESGDYKQMARRSFSWKSKLAWEIFKQVAKQTVTKRAIDDDAIAADGEEDQEDSDDYKRMSRRSFSWKSKLAWEIFKQVAKQTVTKREDESAIVDDDDEDEEETGFPDEKRIARRSFSWKSKLAWEIFKQVAKQTVTKREDESAIVDDDEDDEDDTESRDDYKRMARRSFSWKSKLAWEIFKQVAKQTVTKREDESAIIDDDDENEEIAGSPDEKRMARRSFSWKQHIAWETLKEGAEYYLHKYENQNQGAPNPAPAPVQKRSDESAIADDDDEFDYDFEGSGDEKRMGRRSFDWGRRIAWETFKEGAEQLIESGLPGRTAPRPLVVLPSPRPSRGDGSTTRTRARRSFSLGQRIAWETLKEGAEYYLHKYENQKQGTPSPAPAPVQKREDNSGVAQAEANLADAEMMAAIMASA